MDVLRTVMLRERPRIVEAFERRVRETRLLPDSMPIRDVVDSLDDFLDELAAFATSGSFEALQRVARAHAQHRLRLGFEIRDVVLEYALVQDAIFEVTQAAGVSASGYATLAREIAQASAAAIEEYVRLRDQESRAQTAKHFGFIAHELRNPLTSVRLAVERVRRKALQESSPSLPPGARPSLANLLGDNAYDTIERGLRRLQDLIDNSLVEVKLRTVDEEGTTEREPLLLRAIVDDLAADVAADAEEKRVAIEPRVPAELQVEGDRRLLYSALSNLVRNAIKFTPPGGHIEVRATAVVNDVVIEVEDECGGLRPSSIDKLFDPFVQVGADRSGFGLGLAITRHAAEAHGGHVGVRNVEGRGCVFMITMPRARRA